MMSHRNWLSSTSRLPGEFASPYSLSPRYNYWRNNRWDHKRRPTRLYFH